MRKIFLIITILFWVSVSFGQSNIVYDVQNYEVEIDLANETEAYIEAKVTYNILKGTKTEGFKKFVFSNYIDDSTIEVFDDTGEKLEWYSEETKIKKYSSSSSTLISYKHSGFSGIKTIIYKFKIPDDLNSIFGNPEIKLLNIGKFAINVEKANYIVKFPTKFKPEEVTMLEPNKVSSTKENNQYIYTFTQSDNTTEDVTINYSPAVDKPPIRKVYVFIALAILIVIVIIIKFRKSNL